MGGLIKHVSSLEVQLAERMSVHDRKCAQTGGRQENEDTT